jgi:ABC-type transport system involved in multi-copper enzyme maturation permease subunit
MTAEAAAVAPVAAGARSRPFLGLGTVVRKELTEWLRGPKAVIVLAVAVASAAFTTLIPFIAEATKDAKSAGLLSRDPTANVLLGWNGQTVTLIVILSTMALLSIERDRGTLAWTLTNPVSPSSILLAKFVVATGVLLTIVVIVPLLVSIGLATILYGVPDLRTIATFAVLFCALPIFYVALTVFLGTAVPSTAGVAGLAFAVAFLPPAIGALVPVVAEVSPTSIGGWAMSVAKGQPASLLTPVGWLISMAVLAIAAKLVFDRQEL